MANSEVREMPPKGEFFREMERIFNELVVPGMTGGLTKEVPAALEKLLPGVIEEYFRLHPPQITIINNPPWYQTYCTTSGTGQ